MKSECAVCGKRAVHGHHIVYAQHIRKHGGDLNDPRVLMPLCFDCHGQHHSRARVIPLALVPAQAREYAAELMGAYGEDYLRQYYGAAA